MASRSLLSLILKVVGIFIIRDFLEALSHLLSVLVYLPRYASEKQAYYNLGVTFPPILLYGLFAWFLIFKTDSLVRVVIPGISSDESSTRIHHSVILSIAIIVMGVWLIVNEIPEFFRQAAYYYQERKIYIRMARPDISYIIMSAVRILIGLLLIMFNRTLVNLIEVKRKKTTAWYWPLKAGSKKRNNTPV